MSNQTQEATDGVSHRGIWGKRVSDSRKSSTKALRWNVFGGLRQDTLNEKEIHSQIPTCPTLFCNSLRESPFPWIFVSSAAKREEKSLGTKWPREGPFSVNDKRLVPITTVTIPLLYGRWRKHSLELSRWSRDGDNPRGEPSSRATSLYPQNTSLKVTFARCRASQHQFSVPRAWPHWRLI